MNLRTLSSMLARSSTTSPFAPFHFSFCPLDCSGQSERNSPLQLPNQPLAPNFAPPSPRIEFRLHPNSPSITTALHLLRAKTLQWLQSATMRSKSSHLLYVFILMRPVPSRARSSPSSSDQSFRSSLPIDDTLSKYHSSLHVQRKASKRTRRASSSSQRTTHTLSRKF